MDLRIDRTGFEKVDEVHRNVPEFDEDHLEDRYEDKCEGKDPLHLVARKDGNPVGYALCYDKFDDGSYYVWMAGVKPDSRREGVMSRLIDEILERAREKGYGSVKVKTRNERKGMRHLLIDTGFDVCGYNEKETADRSEILHGRKL